MDDSTTNRFWDKIDAQRGRCWQWLASLSRDGYGQFWDGTTVVPAHRFAYQQFVGAIPEGLTIDHLCRNRRCVNPHHLEAVPLIVNIQRGYAARRADIESRP